jgi:hypothetical protein
MYSILRPLLFRLDPERAHHLTLRLLRIAGAIAPVRAALRSLFCVQDPSLGVRAFGLEFPNPLGLAAGYDKDGAALAGLAARFGPSSGNRHATATAAIETASSGFPGTGAHQPDGPQRAWAVIERLQALVAEGRGGRERREKGWDAHRASRRGLPGWCVFWRAMPGDKRLISQHMGLRRLQRDQLGALRADGQRLLSPRNGRQVPMLVKLFRLGDDELEGGGSGVVSSRW